MPLPRCLSLTSASLLIVAALEAQVPGAHVKRASCHDPTHTYVFEVEAVDWFAPAAEGSVVFTGADGTHVLWRTILVNNPFWAWVDQRRGWVVTFGSEGPCQRSERPEHAVVVYDETGEVIRHVRLSEVLTVDEVRMLGTLKDQCGEDVRSLRPWPVSRGSEARVHGGRRVARAPSLGTEGIARPSIGRFCAKVRDTSVRALTQDPHE